MDARKSPTQSASSSLGLFNVPAAQSTTSTALKPPFSVNNIDSYLQTISAVDNEIILGFESGALYVFDDETGELKRKFAQTDFPVVDDMYDSDDDVEANRKYRDHYYDHRLQLVIPYQQHSLLKANNLDVRELNRETGEQLKSFPSFAGERICSLLETNDGNIFSASCPANLLRLTDGKTGAVIWEHSATPVLFHNSPLMNSVSAALMNHEQLQSYVALLASYIFALEETEKVFTAIKCPNGDIACGTTGGAIFILDAATGNYKNVFRAYEGEKKVPHGFEVWYQSCSKTINALAALPNNDIVSGAQNGPLFIWDHKTGLPKHRLVTDDCENFRVTDIKIYNDLIISKSAYGPSIAIWDSNTGKCLKTITKLYADKFAVTKSGDLVFSRGLNGDSYDIYRLPISYIMQHKQKSISLDEIPFPEAVEAEKSHSLKL